MRKPVLLWVDLTVSSRHAELPDVVTAACDVRVCPDPNGLFQEIERGGLNGICFDMDYPDRRGLELLRRTKAAFPCMPILFLTVQHSESLAVWAFRSRVLDYLVKPLSPDEFQRSARALRGASAVCAGQRSREALDFPAPIPPEIPLRGRPNDVALLPAIYFVKHRFQEKFRSEDVAQACGMSIFRFSRAFREVYGLTFQDFVLRYRILEACRLLGSPQANVTTVAYSVGFNDASYFARTFRRFIGTSPSAYIAQGSCDHGSDVDVSSLRVALNLPDAC